MQAWLSNLSYIIKLRTSEGNGVGVGTARRERTQDSETSVQSGSLGEEKGCSSRQEHHLKGFPLWELL